MNVKRQFLSFWGNLKNMIFYKEMKKVVADYFKEFSC